MADTVLAKKLRDNGDRAAFHLGNISDGTGESKVLKIDVSALAGAPTKVKITKVKWACEGLAVLLYFDADTDDNVLILNGHGEMDELEDAPIIDPASTGHVGDLLLSTQGHSTGDGYSIYIEVQKLA